MKQQILTPSSATVWNREQCDFNEVVEPGGTIRISWRDTEWRLKFKDESVNEIIGYQLAEFLTLPVQPWLAVDVGQIEETGIEKPNLGLLVQEWHQKTGGCSLEYPTAMPAMLKGTALALACFIPNDMEWMTSESEFRLIDFEGCGPAIMFSDRDSWNNLIEGYLNCVRINLCSCYNSAILVKPAFCSALARLAEADLMGIVSFSGHSRANEIAAKAAAFLKPAQKILFHFSCCIAL